MHKLWTMLRCLLFGIAAITILLIIWFIASSFYDETLDSSFNQFFHTDAAVPNDQNGYLALGGIDAPSEAQMSEYGRTIFERTERKPNNDTFIINQPAPESLNCWIKEPSNNDKPAKNPCITGKQLRKILLENDLYLKNYRSLYRYPHFQDTSLDATLFGRDLITIHELALAQWGLIASDGNAEKVMNLWISDTQFIQRLMAGKSSIISKSIFIVLYNMNMKAYPFIAKYLTSEQLAVYQPQLHGVFDTQAFGAGGWDVAATMRWEKEFVFSMLDKMAQNDADKGKNTFFSLALYKPNATRNDFFEVALDMVALSKSAPTEIDEKNSAINEKYDRKKRMINSITFLLYNTVGKLALVSSHVGHDLLLAAADNFNHRQLLKLYTEARIARIPANHMKAFIAVSPVKNLRTNLSFEYDDAKQIFVITDNPEMRFEVHYNEMPVQPASLSNE